MSEDRKKDHIELAFSSQTGIQHLDSRFSYEPLIAAHPSDTLHPFSFLGKTMHAPIWISSMTGGTEKAMRINHNLARAAREFGLGMGLGSCRILLEEDQYPEQFMLKDIIGDEVPFYANLGIAQIEKAVAHGEYESINAMMSRLGTDGLIVHINPLQEWFQPEGERLQKAPIETLSAFIEHIEFPVVVKEVGQGMGPSSLHALMQLPLQAIDFAAYGGTNFAKLELNRSIPQRKEIMMPLSYVGHSAADMLDEVNKQAHTLGHNMKVKEIIVSGGIKSFLDGYYFIRKSKIPAIYGQASMFLKYAQEDYESLQQFIQYQINGLAVAQSYLTLKE